VVELIIITKVALAMPRSYGVATNDMLHAGRGTYSVAQRYFRYTHGGELRHHPSGVGSATVAGAGSSGERTPSRGVRP